jgi:hypothetical protein
MRASILFIKGDWAEYSGTFGFNPWQSTMRPCLFCTSPKSGLFVVNGLSPISAPFHENTDADYEISSALCEVKVELTRELHNHILPFLQYDKRSVGSKGRAVSRDIAGTPILAGDRLEPSDVLPDVGLFDDIRKFPVTITFWRRSRETMVQHRNPLFSADLGISPVQTVTIDALHTLNLGVMQGYAKVVVWALFDAPVWANHCTNNEERLKLSVVCMKAELDVFYRGHRQTHPGQTLTEITDLTPKMFGTRSSPSMSLHGAETWGFLQYLVHTLAKYSGKIGASALPLLEAGQLLVRVQTIINTTGSQVPAFSIQDFKHYAIHNRSFGSLHTFRRQTNTF